MFDFLTDWSLLAPSTRWLGVTDLTCLLGAFLSGLGALDHGRRARAGIPGRSSAARGASLLLTLALVTILVSKICRWQEVNHFPSQTMGEVVVMFSAGLLVSMFVLHRALGLHQRGPGWAVVDDLLMAMVFLGVYYCDAHAGSLSSAQRDLPPALQSYWFTPHIVALIFSYATMGIAALICLVFFCLRFWSGVINGGQTKASQWAILIGLTLVPFAQIVTLPVFLLSAPVFLWLAKGKRLPGPEGLTKLEKVLDTVSFRAFAVGFPFLTAGLWMGSFWAQEAWANYWGWDSKENSALITWLVYVLYIHLRMLGGYRGAKAMGVLMAGALSVFITFQVFGYLPDSQKSLHRYTDDTVIPTEGQMTPGVVGAASKEGS
jgi:cytochrome c-type biogenesis protein CcsB